MGKARSTMTLWPPTLSADDLVRVGRVDILGGIGTGPFTGNEILIDGHNLSSIRSVKGPPISIRRPLKRLLALMLSDKGFHHANFFTREILERGADWTGIKALKARMGRSLHPESLH